MITHFLKYLTRGFMSQDLRSGKYGCKYICIAQLSPSTSQAKPKPKPSWGWDGPIFTLSLLITDRGTGHGCRWLFLRTPQYSLISSLGLEPSPFQGKPCQVDMNMTPAIMIPIRKVRMIRNVLHIQKGSLWKWPMYQFQIEMLKYSHVRGVWLTKMGHFWLNRAFFKWGGWSMHYN